MENKLIEILSIILKEKHDNISINTSSESNAKWDSLNQMNIIVAIEEEFGIEFNDEETITLNSYSLLLDSIKQKLKIA